jgi:HEAT repeat protein
MKRALGSVRAAVAVLAIVSASACDSGPKPGQEGAYWAEQLTNETQPAKRDVAIKHLQELKDPSCVPGLVKELAAPISDERPAVVELLGLLGDASHVDAIVATIDPFAGAGRDKEAKQKTNTNEKAVKAIVRIAQRDPKVADNTAAKTTISKLLKSASLDVQLAAITALGDLKAVDVVPDLVEIADGHPNNFIVKNACESLTKIGDPRAAEVMAKLMFFERDGVSFYREASYGLFVLGKPALPVLEQLWKGEFKPIEQLHIDPLVMKTKAVVVYGDLADPSTFDRLIEAAQTEGSTTGPALLRIEGQRAAGRIGLEKVSAGLKKQMDNVDISQSEHALAALAQMGRREIAAPLWSMTTADGYLKNCKGQDNTEEQCKFNEAQVRTVRLLHWSRLAPGSAAADFDKALAAEQNPKVKEAMEKAKARIDVARECDGKVPCLIEKLKSDSAVARDRAAYELLWQNTDEARDALIGALTDKDNEVRYAAIMGVLRRMPKDNVAIADKVKAQLEAEKGQTQYIRINEDLKRLEIRLRRGY